MCELSFCYQERESRNPGPNLWLISVQRPQIEARGAKQPKMPTMDDHPSFCGRQMTPSPLLFSSPPSATIVTIILGCNVCLSQSLSQTISGHSIRESQRERGDSCRQQRQKPPNRRREAAELLDFDGGERANRKKARVRQKCQHILDLNNSCSWTNFLSIYRAPLKGGS